MHDEAVAGRNGMIGFEMENYPTQSSVGRGLSTVLLRYGLFQ